MRKAVGDKATELGFTLHPRRSRQVQSVNVTDMCFADDIALLLDELTQAKELLHRVETEAAKVGLHINAKKTELMEFNQDKDNDITSIDEHPIKQVDNFKYLGWMQSSERDINVRKALAWTACHRISKIWKFSLQQSIKVSTVESVLLYNCNTWTLTK